MAGPASAALMAPRLRCRYRRGGSEVDEAVRGLRLAHDVRQRAHVRDAGRLDDVRGDALPGGRLALELEHDRGLAERVLAARHRVDAERAQLGIDAGRAVDRLEDGVDRAVAG